MCAGADSIDDVDVVRSGGMKTLFGGVYAPSTIGTLLREFVSGMPASWSRCWACIWRVVWACRSAARADVRAFIDIDSLLRPL